MPDTPKPQSRKENPRWNKKRGQQMRTVLRNMTLFDGEKVLPKPMDITFDKGLIIDVSETPESWDEGTNLFGRFVTPGLVDMHSHHALESWPAVGHNDGNEMHPDTGPVTPMVRIIDSMTARDAAIRIIMSGGVTSSLVIPGSANIMGGEGVPVKNVEMSGPNGEYVVEEMLLEHGVPEEDRRRYIKMACGENPSRVYGHTRMGNAWILRHQLERARALLERQDRYCAGLEDVLSAREEDKVRFVLREGSLPSELELDSSVGLLRGRVLMQNHCYEPRDFETMLRVSREFGFRVRAFHHATEAWQVPEMLKEYGQ
jgi:AraC-like DNA-binding protein